MIGRLTAGQRVYLGAVVVFIVGPFVALIIQSLAFRWDWPSLLPGQWWWDVRGTARLPLAWDYVVSPYSRVWEATLNTVAIGAAVSVLCLVICLPASRVMAREDFRHKRTVELLLAAPLLVPEVAIAIPLLIIFIQLGLAGSFAGIVVAHLIPTIPYMSRMLTAVWLGVGRSIEEQAWTLGASGWATFRLVVLPQIMGGVVAGVLFSFLVSSNVFVLTFMLGQGRIITLPTLLFSKISGASLDASGAGIALVACLPGIILLAGFEKYLRLPVAQR